MSSYNPNASDSIPDVQNYADDRHIPIDRVGIRAIKHPVSVMGRSGTPQGAIGTFCMTVYLPEDRKGTHMSRFAQLLNEHDHSAHSTANFEQLFHEMIRRLDSKAGSIEMQFTYFMNKQAPVTGVSGLIDYDVTLRAEIRENGPSATWVKVVTPVTTLCPCSKEISQYGAHNQRSHVIIDAKMGDDPCCWEDLIAIAESQASCELYSQLKRADEKLVTERAYENPKFVEDLIRDVAKKLDDEPRIRAYTLEVENFESIHNHSAYAMVERHKD